LRLDRIAQQPAGQCGSFAQHSNQLQQLFFFPLKAEALTSKKQCRRGIDF